MEQLGRLEELNEGKHIVVALGEAFRDKVLLLDFDNNNKLRDLFLKVYLKSFFSGSKTLLEWRRELSELSIQDKKNFFNNVCNLFALFLLKNTPANLKKDHYCQQDVELILNFHFKKLENFSLEQWEKLIEKSLSFSSNVVKITNDVKFKVHSALEMDEGGDENKTVKRKSSSFLGLDSLVFSKIPPDILQSFIPEFVHLENFVGRNSESVYPFSSLFTVIKGNDYPGQEVKMSGFLDLLKFNDFSERIKSFAEKLIDPNFLSRFPIDRQISFKRVGERFHYFIEKTKPVSERNFKTFALEFFLSLCLRPTEVPRANSHDDFVFFTIALREFLAKTSNKSRVFDQEYSEEERSILSNFSREDFLKFLESNFSDSPFLFMLKNSVLKSIDFEKKENTFSFSYFNQIIRFQPILKERKISGLKITFRPISYFLHYEFSANYSVLEDFSTLIEEKTNPQYADLKKIFKEYLDDSEFWQNLKEEKQISEIEESLFLDLLVNESLGDLNRCFRECPGEYYTSFLNKFSLADFYTDENFLIEQNKLFNQVSALTNKQPIEFIPFLFEPKLDLFFLSNLSFLVNKDLFNKASDGDEIIGSEDEETFSIEKYYQLFYGFKSSNVVFFAKLLSDGVSVDEIRFELEKLNRMSLSEFQSVIDIYSFFDSFSEVLDFKNSPRKIYDFLIKYDLNRIKNLLIQFPEWKELFEKTFEKCNEYLSYQIEFYESSLSEDLEKISRFTNLDTRVLQRETASIVRFPEIEYSMKLAYIFRDFFQNETIFERFDSVFQKYLVYAKERKNYIKMVRIFNNKNFEAEIARAFDAFSGKNNSPIKDSDFETMKLKYSLVIYLKQLSSSSMTDSEKNEFNLFVRENPDFMKTYFQSISEKNSVNCFLDLLLKNDLFFGSEFFEKLLSEYLENFVKYNDINFFEAKRYCYDSLKYLFERLNTEEIDLGSKQRKKFNRFDDVISVLNKLKMFEFVLSEKFFGKIFGLSEYEESNLSRFVKCIPYTSSKLVLWYIKQIDAILNAKNTNSKVNSLNEYLLH